MVNTRSRCQRPKGSFQQDNLEPHDRHALLIVLSCIHPNPILSYLTLDFCIVSTLERWAVKPCFPARKACLSREALRYLSDSHLLVIVVEARVLLQQHGRLFFLHAEFDFPRNARHRAPVVYSVHRTAVLTAVRYPPQDFYSKFNSF